MYGGTPQDPKHVKVSEKFRNCVPELPGRWQTENLFRVSISLSDSMPDFAMRFKRNMHKRIELKGRRLDAISVLK
jgi:hypothetical protein